MKTISYLRIYFSTPSGLSDTMWRQHDVCKNRIRDRVNVPFIVVEVYPLSAKMVLACILRYVMNIPTELLSNLWLIANLPRHVVIVKLLTLNSNNCGQNILCQGLKGQMCQPPSSKVSPDNHSECSEEDSQFWELLTIHDEPGSLIISSQLFSFISNIFLQGLQWIVTILFT